MLSASHEEMMALALKQAGLAAAMGEVPVGAVLVLENGDIFSTHNAPITNHDGTAHAEIAVMREAMQATGNYRLIGSTLYVTLEPCLMCAGAMIHARIKHVVYGADDLKTGAVSSLYQALSDERLNHQPQITKGVLADECAATLRTFFQGRRKAKKAAQD